MRKHPWLTTAVIIAAIGVFLYFYVEWHAEKRWQRYAAEARARGVKLYPADFVRPEIPDAQNFAALPMLKKAFAGGKDSAPFKLPRRPRPAASKGAGKSASYNEFPPGYGNPRKGEKIDWKEWQKYFQEVGFLTEITDNPVRDVLHALDHYAPQVQEWSEWRTTRPRCRLPIDPVKGKPVSSSVFADAVEIFRLCAAAHLAAGDSPAAYADFQDGRQAPRAQSDHPGLVSGVLRIGMMHFLLAAVGEGLRDHTWADAELKKIERDLASVDLWKDYCESLASERAMADVEIEKMMSQPFRKRIHAQDYAWVSPSTRAWALFQTMPRSLYRDNQWRLNRYFDELTASNGMVGQTFKLDRPTPSSPKNIVGSYEKDYYCFCGLMGEAISRLKTNICGCRPRWIKRGWLALSKASAWREVFILRRLWSWCRITSRRFRLTSTRVGHITTGEWVKRATDSMAWAKTGRTTAASSPPAPRQASNST